MFARPLFPTGKISLIVALMLGFSVSARAHVVIMKDGFTIRGTVKREMSSVVEPNVYMKIPKLNGFFMVDDGARRIVFSHRHVSKVLDSDIDDDADLRFERKIVRLDKFKVPAGRYEMATPFDEKWDRVFTLDTGRGKVQVPQHLSLLTPHYARVDARRYNWTPHYLTAELDPLVVRSLLSNHPDLKANGKEDGKKRIRISHFLLRAGMADLAAQELKRIAADLPDQRDQVEAARTELKKILAAKYVDLLEQAQSVGRHQLVRAKVESFPKDGMDETLLARVRTLQTSMETAEKNLAVARRLLDELPERVADPSLRPMFSQAAASIAAELTADNASQLEVFVQSAQNKQQQQYSSEQLLALAVSGWYLGKDSADAKIETARRLWRSRRFILDYQRTHDVQARQQMLASYQAEGALAFDELAQLIARLPPPEPWEGNKRDRVLLALGGLPYSPAPMGWVLYSMARDFLRQPQTFQVDLPWNFRTSASYQALVPPEYHPGRSYPVLIALHDAAERPEEMFRRWTTFSDQNGYFLVVPQWQEGARQQYGYTAQEHTAVLDTVRDLRRRFAIDSDRIFLTGFGEGANMAFDVGLSHPDLFAGVLPIAARLKYFAKAYWPNAFCLPFYVVGGDLDGDASQLHRAQFQHWVPGGYPALWIEYKGRGQEWFSAEVPFMFDWMNRKRRASGYPDLGRGAGGGRGDEYQSMRSTDNRYYWLEGEDLSDRHINNARSWSNKTGAACLQARGGGGNLINITVHGFRRVIVWLSQGMVDFEKPVTININSRVTLANRKINPNLETLLGDFYLRGDRQRLFSAKVEITP